MTYQILTGSCLDILPTLPAESVHVCVTSPPYFGLRDYGTATWEGGDSECDHARELPATVSRSSTLGPNNNGAGVTANQENAEWSRRQYRSICAKCNARRIDAQIGLENTVSEYVANMVAVFREVWRVLHPSATVWLNLGSSYSSKQLLGEPWRVAFALQDAGWYLRSEITWVKRAPMPESVLDRPTSATEKVFLLTKRAKYFYDAEAVRQSGQQHAGAAGTFARTNGKNTEYEIPGQGYTSHRAERNDRVPSGANMRNYLILGPESFNGAHFATMPTKLVEPCILAGSSAKGVCSACGNPWERVVEKEWHKHPNGLGNGTETKDLQTHRRGATSAFRTGGSNVSTTTGWTPTCQCNAHIVPATVLDPFAGSGTVGCVALKHGRRFVGIELSPEYVELAHKRIAPFAAQPMLLEAI